MTSFRSGLGFDLHPLVDGRPLVLGGVTVPAERGLGGHSDADVLTHAVCEALLGSLALGDLGRLFPDTDPRYKGASSLGLLRSVVDLISTRGARVINVDATVICQAPRLGSFLPEMAKQLAATMELGPGQVSVKAKSPEHLGLLGRGEGIASMAVVSVEVNSSR
ncbi:MAG TPA: 2-C-methyl-D-erythritol 2,4-cyclodiphosphate synthase [Methylomirabilota bacterium]|jgi:2-C-methyl-D-erythritol 2,4-cyclodiphosphate synthase